MDPAPPEFYPLPLPAPLPFFQDHTGDQPAPPVPRTGEGAGGPWGCRRPVVGRRRARCRASAATVRLETRREDRKSTRLNSSHANISYAVFCLKKKLNVSPYTK